MKKEDSINDLLNQNLDSSNYAPKANLENATGADRSDFDRKVDEASLKAELDQLDIGRLKTVSGNLNKLCGVLNKNISSNKAKHVLVEYKLKEQQDKT